MSSTAVIENLDQLTAFRTMSAERIEQLRPLTKYIWWESPEEALRFPSSLVAQVMDIGTFEDVVLLSELISEDELRSVLANAEAGQFNPRSWHYWHYRLGLSRPKEVPPMPLRRTE